jgi:diguanylate cyclase (GGDEF)-like protein/PAS domain S-box-containing protein
VHKKHLPPWLCPALDGGRFVRALLVCLLFSAGLVLHASCEPAGASPRAVAFTNLDHAAAGQSAGAGQAQISAPGSPDGSQSAAAAVVLTLCVLAVLALTIRQAARIDHARREINARTETFQSALQNMPQGLAMFDAKKRLIMCNAQYGRLYDEAPDELKPGITLGQILEKRIARGLYRDSGTQQFLREQYGREPLKTSETRELRNGRIIAVTVAPMAGGGWVTTHEDITEARRRQASFELLFDGNPIPMWVFDIDTLRFLAVNKTAIASYGYSHDQFLAMTVLDIRPPEHRRTFADFVRTQGGVHNGEQIWPHQLADGTTIDVAIYSRGLNYNGHAAALVAAINVTDRVRAEGELRQTKSFLSALIESVPVPISVRSADELRFIFVNRAMEALVDRARDQLIGRTVHDLFPTSVADDIRRSDLEALRSDQPTITERRRLYTGGGIERVVTARRIAIREENGAPQYLLSTLEDITERTRWAEQIAHMARYDALTSLGNRALLLEKIEDILVHTQRHGRTFAVHALDLDRFKSVNDTLGHPAGDALLTVVARRLLACAGETDTVVRLGGDEFAVIQAIDDDPRESAIVLATRILEALVAPYDLDGQKVITGTSIGIALAPHHGDSADLLMKRADLALYKVKAEGGNGFQFFESELEIIAHARRALEIDLREAIAHEQFEVHYQPVVGATSRRTVSVEALVRWRHPQRGMVPPGEFIALAEETGLIVPLGDWILRKVCADAAQWPSDIKVAVNLSPVQFKKSNLFEIVAEALEDSGLAPERLELEITETVLLQQNEANLAVLHRLRDLGTAIVLDDFGTGYSSLSYLRMFPFDKIKIDKSFVDDMPTRADSAAIVCAIIGMAKGLAVTTTAEGVETEEQFGLLQAAGCTQVQGYLFSAAVPASQLDFIDGPMRRLDAKVA